MMYHFLKYCDRYKLPITQGHTFWSGLQDHPYLSASSSHISSIKLKRGSSILKVSSLSVTKQSFLQTGLFIVSQHNTFILISMLFLQSVLVASSFNTSPFWKGHILYDAFFLFLLFSVSELTILF